MGGKRINKKSGEKLRKEIRRERRGKNGFKQSKRHQRNVDQLYVADK